MSQGLKSSKGFSKQIGRGARPGRKGGPGMKGIAAGNKSSISGKSLKKKG